MKFRNPNLPDVKNFPVLQSFSVSEENSYIECQNIVLYDLVFILQAQLERDPEDFHDKENQNDLHLLVDDIVTGASNLAESVCTREKTRQKIFNETRHIKVAIKGLVDECDNHVRAEFSKCIQLFFFKRATFL